MLNHTILSINMERQFKNFGNKVRYLKYDVSTVKNKYGESKVKTYVPPIEFDALVKFNPPPEKLEEYGMDKDNVKVIVKLLTVQVDYAKLVVSPDDVVEINGERFFISSIKPDGMVGDKPILLVLGCGRMSENRGT